MTWQRVGEPVVALCCEEDEDRLWFVTPFDLRRQREEAEARRQQQVVKGRRSAVVRQALFGSAQPGVHESNRGSGDDRTPVHECSNLPPVPVLVPVLDLDPVPDPERTNDAPPETNTTTTRNNGNDCSEETATAIETVADEVAGLSEGRETRAALIEKFSRIERGNGYPSKSFDSPRRRGVSEPWAQATLARLTEHLREWHKPVPL